MTRFQVKVCGITRVKTAELVARLGGDMIGMIFYRQSPRFITQANAREVSKLAPPTLDRVGVFVDEDVEKILRVADKVRLDIIQLHGDERLSDVVRLQREGYKVIKTHTVTHTRDFKRLLSSRADLVMVDNRSGRMPGGTGKPFDWSFSPQRKVPNLVLAGGISIENVAEGVRRFDPLVVDVNSGVESAPGRKSPKKLRKFFETCDVIRYGK